MTGLDLSTKNDSCDIAVVGAGPMGVMTAIAAARGGFKVFLFDDSPLSSLEKSLGVIWPSPNDLLTRVESKKNRESAEEVLEVFKESQKLWLKEFPSLFQKALNFRMASEALLKREMKQASEKRYISRKISDGLYQDFPAQIVDCAELKTILLQVLVEEGVTLVKQKVSRLLETCEFCQVTTDKGETYHSEVAFVATSHNVSTLLPNRGHTYSPMADVLAVYESTVRFDNSFTLRSSNGHIAVAASGNTLAFSGPKFMVPSAGVGKVYSQISPQITAKLQQFEAFQRSYLNQFVSESPFGELPINDLKLKSFTGFTDSLPRDELPVLGELGGSGRIFGTFGWLGAGLSAAPWVAQAFIKSLEEGSVSHIPGCFLARRLQDF